MQDSIYGSFYLLGSGVYEGIRQTTFIAVKASPVGELTHHWYPLLNGSRTLAGCSTNIMLPVEDAINGLTC